ncbi:hypothetical protein D3C73_1209590 [compost metagenome]
MLLLLTAPSGLLGSAEHEEGPHHIERYEHKLSQAARLLPQPLKSVPVIRAVQHGNPLADGTESSAPVRCVLLYPLFYIFLKRLLLEPLKYKSNYVEHCGRSSGCNSVPVPIAAI